MKKKNKKKQFDYIYISLGIITLGLLITCIGLFFMLKETIKYKEYYILDGTVLNYHVKTEGEYNTKDKTSYLYTVSYKIKNSSKKGVLSNYIEDEYHYNDKIELIVSKKDNTKIDIYRKNDKSIILSLIGISISFVGLIAYILIKKYKK